MKIRIFFLHLAAFLFLAALTPCIADTVTGRLYINKGGLVTVDSISLPCLAFNSTRDFFQNSAVVTVAQNDTLLLRVYNYDDKPHGFAVKNTSINNIDIQPDESRIISISGLESGTYIYYDPKDFPKNSYLGLAGILYVKDGSSDKNFFWNLHEYQSNWSRGLVYDSTVQVSEYDPEYFTINGLSNPDIEEDSTAIIRGTVGERMLLSIANTGLSTHSIHFHGYHLRVLFSSENTGFKNRVKDTFRVTSMNTYVLELIPDKPGLFPIHDHNLIANTGGLMYPNGMFMMMDIKE
ncbi:MAG: multicopper oxidase domain-containing protein [Bacteroidota bacterium]